MSSVVSLLHGITVHDDQTDTLRGRVKLGILTQPHHAENVVEGMGELPEIPA